jgi:cation diffusion facilitator family transporter
MLERWLVGAFVADPDEISSSRTREQFGRLEGWVSIVVNVAVFAAKLVSGLLIGSISLIADAFHSLGDVLGSGVVIWGFRVAAKPSDPEHPFGHGRFESIAALVVALLLSLTAWEFGKASLLRLLHPRAVTASVGLLALLAATLVVKEWLARFSRSLGRRISSSVLIGDFWHHRSDVLATAVVMLALVAGRLGATWVDGVGGLVVSGFIAWTAFAVVRDSIDPLLGEAPSPQVLQEMREMALSVAGVDGVHDLIVHRYGGLVVASMHVEVSADLDIARGHDVAEAVEQKLNERLGGWSVVHVDPVDRFHPLYQPVSTFLEAEVPRLPGSPSFHDLRIVGTESPCYVIFDLKTEGDPQPDLAGRLADSVSVRFPAVAKVHVIVQPRYVY